MTIKCVYIFNAIVNNNLPEAFKLIKEIDPDELINTVDEHGSTVLHIACFSGHIEIVKLLLSIKPELINIVDNYSWTGLHVACAHRYIDIAKLLLFIQPQLINEVNKYGSTTFHIACSQGHIEMIKLLLTIKPELIDEVNLSNWMGLHVACIKGHIKVVKLLLTIKPEMINLKVNNKTLIKLSIEEQNFIIAKFLISIGASIEEINFERLPIKKEFKVASLVDKLIKGVEPSNETMKVLFGKNYNINCNNYEQLFLKRFKHLCMINVKEQAKTLTQLKENFEYYNQFIPKDIYDKVSAIIKNLGEDHTKIKILAKKLLESNDPLNTVILPQDIPSLKFIINSDHYSLVKLLKGVCNNDDDTIYQLTSIAKYYSLSHFFQIKSVRKDNNISFSPNLFLGSEIINLIAIHKQQLDEVVTQYSIQI